MVAFHCEEYSIIGPMHVCNYGPLSLNTMLIYSRVTSTGADPEEVRLVRTNYPSS